MMKLAPSGASTLTVADLSIAKTLVTEGSFSKAPAVLTMFRRLVKFTAILLPSLIGVVLCTAVGKKIVDRYKLRNQVQPISIANGTPLPHGFLVNIDTRRDEYSNVTRGKVLLVFITTGCDACRKELLNLSQAAPSLKSSVQVYGVGIEDPDEVKNFVQDKHEGFPILLDHGAYILARLGFKYMPTKVLLNDGRVSRIWYGSSPNAAVLIKDVGEVDPK
jgi:peroxiredoxin